MRSELFLQKYRVLEGLLEKRYEGRRLTSSSVVIEYIRDGDSAPIRVDLDLLREIRNILSHNAGSDGQSVVEPSQEMLDRLDGVIEYVRRPRLAADFGTPAERILCAHMNDRVYHVMQAMQNNGYSHVPILEGGGIVGVFSIKSLFDCLSARGLGSLNEDSRISALGDKVSLEHRTGERYMFMAADATITAVRSAFDARSSRNGRLSAVFLTQTGKPQGELICMLTPWDVLSAGQSASQQQKGKEEKRHGAAE